MWTRVLGKHYDERRLRRVLAFLFLALAVPTGAVLWQAYGQLKWEAFHQYRGQAEEFTNRIDAQLAERISAIESRSFAEYSFLNVGGDSGAGYLQRSPLSAFPVHRDLPGVIGYFQVDAQGRFSTPLLPESGAGAAALGISEPELRAREELAEELRRILAGNSLVEGREVSGPASQAMFDRLNQPPPVASSDRQEEPLAGPESFEPDLDRADSSTKVADLMLDDALQKKSESVEEKADNSAREQPRSQTIPSTIDRARRVEQAALPEASDAAGARAPGPQPAQELRITTFESEIDPFEFSLLNTGEFVLFRKVWRDGKRFVQGILLDRSEFLDQMLLSAFRASGLSDMSSLVIGLGEDVIQVVPASHDGPSVTRSATRGTGMEGELLYRSRLSSPLDSIELIFALDHLPAGPGAAVLGWTTVLLGVVFGLGFLALYRLGLGQIRLARQQQDFVSSVSHELKTPLTSIRMYSEMLKEGWADESRRAQYYAFIHDESERLSRLISNVLQLASITRNEPALELRPVMVGELLDRIASKVASQVERSDFEFSLDLRDDARAAVVEIDEDCMIQIVINLVDNAIKFSRDAEIRRVEIGARLESDNRVRFSVRDYGPGIPREQMKKIFRLFYRPRSELTRETVGTGIGLAIVHQLTTAMGGEVDVRNRKPGAEFGILLRNQDG